MFLVLTTISAAFISLVVTLAVAALGGVGSVLNHMKGNEEAMRAVIKHVLMPIFGAGEEPEPEKPEVKEAL